MPYDIEITDLAVQELKAIRAFDRRRVVEEIKQQLASQPSIATRNRKRLDAAAPVFQHVPPIWELRVGSYRVFYDVDEANQKAYVRAVRHKGPQQTTGDILQ